MVNKINKLFKGKLLNIGNIFVKYLNVYKVNLVFMVVIFMYELVRGILNIVNIKNNFFGMKKNGDYMSFFSVDEGIKRGISNLLRNYIYIGWKILESIRNKYFFSLDKEWVKCVGVFYK